LSRPWFKIKTSPLSRTMQLFKKKVQLKTRTGCRRHFMFKKPSWIKCARLRIALKLRFYHRSRKRKNFPKNWNRPSLRRENTWRRLTKPNASKKSYRIKTIWLICFKISFLRPNRRRSIQKSTTNRIGSWWRVNARLSRESKLVTSRFKSFKRKSRNWSQLRRSLIVASLTKSLAIPSQPFQKARSLPLNQDRFQALPTSI
jgi:hypothetical protein